MHQPNALSRVVSDTIWTIASSVFLAFSGVGLNLVVGNLFGEDGLGIYALVTTIYLFTSNLSAIGQPIALTKHTAQYSDEPEVGHQYYAAALLIVSLTGPLAGIVLLLIRPWLGQVFHMPELSHLLVAVAISIPLFLLNKVASGRLNGLRQMRSMAIAESLRYVFIFALTAGLLVLVPGELEASIWALLGAEILLLPVFWRSTRLFQSLSVARFRERLRQLGAFGGQVLLSRLIAELNVRLDLMMTGFFLTSGEIGVYATALMFAQGIGILSVAIQKVTTPIMAELFAKGRISELEHLVNRTMQIVALLLVPLTVVMVGFFPQIIAIMYPGKPGFLHAYLPVVILSTGFLLRGIVVPVSSIYLSCGRPDLEYKVAIVFLAVNLAIAVALVGAWRVNGIAVAASAKAIAEFTLYTALMRRTVGVRVRYRPLLLAFSVFVIMTGSFALIGPGILSAGLSLVLLFGFGLMAIRIFSLDSHLTEFFPALARFRSR